MVRDSMIRINVKVKWFCIFQNDSQFVNIRSQQLIEKEALVLFLALSDSRSLCKSHRQFKLTLFIKHYLYCVDQPRLTDPVNIIEQRAVARDSLFWYMASCLDSKIKANSPKERKGKYLISNATTKL